MKILTNDPSITAWGWAVINLDNDNTEIIESGCIRTKAEHKKRRIRKSDDMARRLSDIATILQDIIERHDIDWVLSEAPHGSQSAAAARMIGAVAGLVVGIGTALELPVEWYSEGDAKKHLSGRRSLTKEKTIELITEIYGSDWQHKYKYQNEAVADSLAVFHVGRKKSEALIYASNQ